MNTEPHYETAAAMPDLSSLVIPLLKGVIYRDETGARNAGLWNGLLELQARVRDYVAVLGLELVLDEAEGYAFLRKKLAEFDAGGGQDEEGVRLVLSREDIVELLRVFLPEASNEARLMDRVDTDINKVVELGFLRRMKPVAGQPPAFEVRRILKAFVDAQWLADFDTRLAVYRSQFEEPDPGAHDE
jgi:Domain of unknown function (DUF4194)